MNPKGLNEKGMPLKLHSSKMNTKIWKGIQLRLLTYKNDIYDQKLY
jgi:hypothetical protein